MTTLMRVRFIQQFVSLYKKNCELFDCTLQDCAAALQDGPSPACALAA
jgi:hypothetical protein